MNTDEAATIFLEDCEAGTDVVFQVKRADARPSA